MENCTLCKMELPRFVKAIMIQEDADLRAAQEMDDEGSWDWLPMGHNGMHYAIMHVDCWGELLATLITTGRSAGFMFYIGEVDTLKGQALCLN